MRRRRIYGEEGHVHFVTFSCYKRGRLLDEDRAKRVVISILGTELVRTHGSCIGFVVMPDHVHAMVCFPEANQLSFFMKQWKQRTSVQIKKLFRERLVEYAKNFDLSEPVWQSRYYDFNVFSDKKVTEKLEYMHTNPVRAGLMEEP